MGEAKKRGTYEDRVAAAVAKREARELAWNKAQAERRAEHLAEKQVMIDKPVRTGQGRARPSFVMAVALTIAASSINGR